MQLHYYDICFRAPCNCKSLVYITYIWPTLQQSDINSSGRQASCTRPVKGEFSTVANNDAWRPSFCSISEGSGGGESHGRLKTHVLLCWFCRVYPRSASTCSSRSSSSSGWWASLYCTPGTTSTRWSPSTTDRHFTSKSSLWRREWVKKRRKINLGSAGGVLWKRTLDVLIKKPPGPSSKVPLLPLDKHVLYYFSFASQHLTSSSPSSKRCNFQVCAHNGSTFITLPQLSNRQQEQLRYFFLLFLYFSPPTFSFSFSKEGACRKEISFCISSASS